MSESKYITPRLGLRSASILSVMLVAAIALVLRYHATRATDVFVSESSAFSSFSIRMWLTGLIYGLAAGGCWLATLVRRRYLRWLTRTALIIVLAILWDRVQEENWLRHLANLGGLAITQCMLFAWLRIPNWKRLSTRNSTIDEDPTKFQYGIGDVGIATTCVALLLGIVIRYPPPTDPSWYWSVLALSWVLAPLITVCIARSILDRHRFGVSFGFLAILISVMSVAGLTTAELMLVQPNRTPPTRDTIELLASLYGRVVLGYGLTFAAFAVAGRIDAAAKSPAELDS